jgi:hypothetical protein
MESTKGSSEFWAGASRTVRPDANLGTTISINRGCCDDRRVVFNVETDLD